MHDVHILDDLIPEPGSYTILDRGYLDFARLYRLTRCCAFFVTRAKSNLQFRRLYSHPVDKSSGLQCDQTIVLSGFYAAKDYPDKLRRTRYYDAETKKELTFLSNNFIVYVLVAIVKKRLQLEASLYTILQILSVTAFEQVPIMQVLTNFDYKSLGIDSDKQLLLMEL